MPPDGTISVRRAADADMTDVTTIQRRAFGAENEAALTASLLADPTAGPALSLIALKDGAPAGHILFTRARLTGPRPPVSAALLAPLAVIPEQQGRGVGSRLIATGLRELSDAGTDLIFVFGDPAYYGRHGFSAAQPVGLLPPYPIPEKYAEAWMVQALRQRLIGRVHGKLQCADALNSPELWRV